MPVNLNNLNISLDKFNDAASGQFNIGQLKLGEDGASVVRTNSRKVLTFLNKTHIRPEESLAIKNAFCDALRREGLSDGAVTEIRHKLGLRDTMRETLAAGNIKPLSAAEVREIIDEYAGQINQARGSGKPQLATSTELYRGVSEKTLNNRKLVREERNAKSESIMETSVGGTVNQMLDLLESAGGETDMGMSTKAIALEIGQALKSSKTLSTPGASLSLTVAPVTLTHSASGTIVAKFTLDDGSEFSVDTNLTRTELRDQMAKAISPNRSPAQPKEPEGEEPQAQTEPPKAQTEPPKVPTEPPKVPGEPPKANPPAAPKKKSLDPAYEPVIEDLKRVFSIVKDPVAMAASKARVLPTLHKVIKGVALSDETLEVHANSQVRQKLTNQVVDGLVAALRNARGLDTRNTELVNQVRNVIAGDKRIDADALVEKIIDVLSTEPVDFSANIGQETEDDFDKPLNINELLGNNG
ncbi:MAG: hypothetical protein IKQ55_05495 [Kiritimatiellae bacterium]|nr:hypothetical protein [Kiritimatiellia bacterium]